MKERESGEGGTYCNSHNGVYCDVNHSKRGREGTTRPLSLHQYFELEIQPTSRQADKSSAALAIMAKHLSLISNQFTLAFSRKEGTSRNSHNGIYGDTTHSKRKRKDYNSPAITTSANGWTVYVQYFELENQPTSR